MEFPFPEEVFRNYDIRGQAETQLTPRLFKAIGQALPMFLPLGNQPVCVGRDNRVSSSALADALCHGLAARGQNIIDLGVTTTPLVYWGERHFFCKAGLMVTGSHTPPEKNGLKFSVGKKPFFGNELQKLYQALKNPPPQATPTGTIEMQDIRRSYINNILQQFPAHKFRKKIVWDAGPGTMAFLWDILREKLPACHFFAQADTQEHFALGFDPTKPAAAKRLHQTILQEKAEMGFAFDGDGDRFIVMEPSGYMWMGDELSYFFASHQASQAPCVIDVKSSNLLFRNLQHNRQVFTSATGHPHVKAMMQCHQASFGAELSGHYFFADHYFGFDDGLYAALRFLDICNTHNVCPRQWRQALPQRFSSRELRLPLPSHQAEPILASLQEWAQKENGELQLKDGIKVITPQGWWIARASQTESLISIRWEATTKEYYEEIAKKLKRTLSKKVAKLF